MLKINERNPRLVLVCLVGMACWGGYAAYLRAWVCDDSFLSLRYAENWLSGYGLVFNRGEPVEGYTNFLWVMFLTLHQLIGIEATDFLKYSGLPFYLVTGILLGFVSYRYARENNQLWQPLGAALYFCVEDLRVWATGGIKTSLFGLLCFISLWLTRSPEYSRARLILAGVNLSVLVLTRLDGALICLVACLSVLYPNYSVSWKQRLLQSLYLIVPVTLTLSGFLAFKYFYYGELMPTAFYAKSVLRPYYSQGVVYLGSFLIKNWGLALVLAFVIFMLVSGRCRALSLARDARVYMAGVLIYGLYVVHVGGDFMHARRFAPLMPLLLVSLDVCLMSVTELPKKSVMAVIFWLSATFSYPVFSQEKTVIKGVADEPRFYPPVVIEQRKAQGQVLRSALADLDVKVLIDGGLLVLAYYSKLPYVVEQTGLTQYEIARQVIKKRSHIGHEKTVSLDWPRENNIDLRITQAFPDQVRSKRQLGVNEIVLGGMVSGVLLRYSEPLMSQLQNRPGVEFHPIEKVIEFTCSAMQSSQNYHQAKLLFDRLFDCYYRHPGAKHQQALTNMRHVLDALSKRKKLTGNG